jgi:hypothetical protein
VTRGAMGGGKWNGAAPVSDTRGLRGF